MLLLQVGENVPSMFLLTGGDSISSHNYSPVS